MVSQCTTSTVGHIVKAVSAAQIIEIRNSCRPLDAVVDAEDFLPLPRHWKRGDVELFLLRVHGDSMEPEIHDGDLVAVRAQPAAESGDLVVAVLKGNAPEGEATVKRFRSKGKRHYLEAINPRYAPIPLVEGATIAGVVVGLLRDY